MIAKKLYFIFLCNFFFYIGEDGREGWFDAWSLLTSFQKKAVSLGVEYIQGECVQLNIDSKVSSVKVRMFLLLKD